MQTISPNVYISNNLLKLQNEPPKPIEDLIDVHMKSGTDVIDKQEEATVQKFDWNKKLKVSPPKQIKTKITNSQF